jgi:hypothetical protein
MAVAENWFNGDRKAEKHFMDAASIRNASTCCGLNLFLGRVQHVKPHSWWKNGIKRLKRHSLHVTMSNVIMRKHKVME